MMWKIVIFAIVKQSVMSEEEKKTDDGGKTIPNPEGYTIVKYAEGWVWVSVFVVGTMISTLLLYVFRNAFSDRDWLIWGVFIGVFVILWVIMRKITEVKVNLKITEEGLEQTRLSGSKIYPEYRLIKWDDMRHYYLHGRSRDNAFLISVIEDTDFRISIPLLPLFEKQKDNWKNYIAFHEDFWEIAPEHDVHRAFFG